MNTSTIDWKKLIEHKHELMQRGPPKWPRTSTCSVTKSQADMWQHLGGSEWLRQQLNAIQAQMPEEIYNDPANHKVSGSPGINITAPGTRRDPLGRVLPLSDDTTRKNIGVAMTDIQYNVYRTINAQTWLREQLDYQITQQQQTATPQQPAAPAETTPQQRLEQAIADPRTQPITKEWLQAQLEIIKRS